MRRVYGTTHSTYSAYGAMRTCIRMLLLIRRMMLLNWRMLPLIRRMLLLASCFSSPSTASSSAALTDMVQNPRPAIKDQTSSVVVRFVPHSWRVAFDFALDSTKHTAKPIARDQVCGIACTGVLGPCCCCCSAVSYTHLTLPTICSV
eukprot:685093-Rhodomonas_salina.1